MVDVPDPQASRTVDLIRRHRDGDPAALNHLFERYYGRVFRLARIELAGAPITGLEPADVVQDVFVRLTESLDSYEERSDAKWISWVATVTRNIISNHRRDTAAGKRGGRQRSTPLQSASGSWLQVEEQITRVASRVARSEEAARLDRCVPRLPEDQRRVVILRDYEGHEWAEVGRQMERSPEACQQLHARAGLQLLRLLRQL